MHDSQTEQNQYLFFKDAACLSHFLNGNILNVHFYRLDFRIHARTYTKYFVS